MTPKIAIYANDPDPTHPQCQWSVDEETGERVPIGRPVGAPLATSDDESADSVAIGPGEVWVGIAFR